MKIEFTVEKETGDPYILIIAEPENDSLEERMLDIFLTQVLNKGLKISAIGDMYFIKPKDS